MSKKYQTSNRCYLIDHHSPQPPIVPLDSLNIDDYDQFITEANIDSLMVYCKDHWGVVYYDSKVPSSQKHRGIQGDWIAKKSALLKEKGIEFIAYYCIEYDEGAARLHPEWQVKKSDGTALIRDDLYAKWHLCCYQTNYRNYCIEQMKEIVTNYAPDALFMDIFGASLCYCENCKQNFLANYHYELPESKEEIALHRTDIIDFLNQNAKDFLTEVKYELKSIDPTLAITINFSCHYPKDIRDMLDYQFSEPLLKDNWFSSAYARDVALGQYPILSPGEASQVYNYASDNEYIYDLSAIAAQGCRVGMYSGSQHIDGTLDTMEAKKLGLAYSEIAKMEPHFQNRHPVKCVGIIQSDTSMSIHHGAFAADTIVRMKNHSPHQDAILGAMQLCEQNKLPYCILPETTITPEYLKQFDLLILPELYVVTDALQSSLETYTANGGTLFASMQTGLWNADSTLRSSSTLASLFGINTSNIHNEYEQNGWAAYLNAKDCTLFSPHLFATTPPVSKTFVETKTTPTAKTLLTFTKPCVACTDTKWVNWWSPPPGDKTNLPALIQNTYKNGKTFFFAFDFFTMAASENFPYTTTLFSDLISLAKITPPLSAKSPSPTMVRTAYFETEKTYIIHQISQLPKLFAGETALLSENMLIANVPLQCARLVYPVEQALHLEKKDTVTTIALPDFSLQQIIICEKE